jgi:hypothetical protein
MENEYSVCQFFEDGSYEYVRRWVSAEEAMKAVQHYINSVGARMGLVKRVIVTDGGDMTNFEWEYGKGIVFPTKEMLDAAKNEGNSNGPTN